MKRTMSPELEFLIASLRSDLEPARPAGFDDTVFQRLVHRHAVGPLVDRGRPSAANIAAHLHASALVAELLRLNSLFDSHGISLLAYKGPPLGQLAYGDAHLRICSDLDLLVRPETREAAEALLLAHGYRSADAEAGTGAHPQDEYHRGYVRTDGRGAVELHWGFAPAHHGHRPDLERIWRRAETVPIPGGLVRSPAPEDLLPLLCEHGAKHCWERLEWLCAVAGLIDRHRDRDWGAVTAMAKLRDLLFHLGNANERDRTRWLRPFRLMVEYGHPWPILKKLIGRS